MLQSHLQTDVDGSWTSQWFPELQSLLPVPLGILLILNWVLLRYLRKTTHLLFFKEYFLHKLAFLLAPSCF